MSGKPRISIQICARNCAPFLLQALASAAFCAGEGDAIEIIYFDDASDDGSLDVVKGFAAKCPKLRVFGSESNLGMAGAWNAAVERTEADYILRLDGDDILMPGCIGEQLKLLDANPDAAMAYGKMICADAALRPNGNVMGRPFSRFDMANFNPAGHGGAMIRRSHLLEAGLYKETHLGRGSVGLDYFLWWRLSPKLKILFIDKFCYIYRRHGAQNTSVRQANFQACKDYMMDSCLSLNPSLSERLKADPGAEVEERDRMHAMLILGILAARADNEALGRIARAAVMLDPSDYGAHLGLFKHLAKAGRYDEALNVCRPWAIEESAAPFIRMEIAEQAEKLLNFLNRREEGAQWGVIAKHFCQLHMGFDPRSSFPEGFVQACGIPMN